MAKTLSLHPRQSVLDYSETDFRFFSQKGPSKLDKTIFSSEYQQVVELLREHRAKAGLTQVELAALLGVTQSFVSKLERGERVLEIIQLRFICQTLGTTLPKFTNTLEKRIAKLS